MIIAFSGDLGSGKSTIAKKIAEKLNIPRYYAGQFFREMAKERGLTVIELAELAKKDDSIDKATDAKARELAEKTDDFVIETRTAQYFLPNSIKIYFKVSPGEGARRIFQETQKNDFRENEDDGMKTIEEVELSNKKRMSTDIDRYKKYYNIDISDMKNYDFILDTTSLTPDEVFEKTLDYIKSDKRFKK